MPIYCSKGSNEEEYPKSRFDQHRNGFSFFPRVLGVTLYYLTTTNRFTSLTPAFVRRTLYDPLCHADTSIVKVPD